MKEMTAPNEHTPGLCDMCERCVMVYLYCDECRHLQCHDCGGMMHPCEWLQYKDKCNMRLNK